MAAPMNIILCCFAAGILLLQISPAVEGTYGKVPLFIFGDSNFDVGNNNHINTNILFRADMPPHGVTFFGHATGRFSDGRLMGDFIAEYANLPYLPPYHLPGNNEFQYGVNFASSGGGSLAGTFTGMAINIGTQVENFKNVKNKLVEKLGKEETNQLLSNAVYLFSMGSNDYLFPFQIGANSSFFEAISEEQYVDNVVESLVDFIKKIYTEGGRKFGYVNVGPLNCFPVSRAMNPVKLGECREDLEVLVKLHNVKFPKELEKLESELEGFKYSLFNLNAAASERINNPSNYGFKESKTSCCGSGPFRGLPSCGRGDHEFCGEENVNDVLFWDFVHYNEKAHGQLAELIWTGNEGLTKPYSLKALFEDTNNEISSD